MTGARSILLMVTVLAAAGPSWAAGPTPRGVGACVASRIKLVGHRLDGDPSSGSLVVLTNGIPGVSYDPVPAVDQARAGDPVTVCLVSLPKDCPPGDDRGKIYAMTDHRTHRTWRLPDAAHSCGGA